MFSAWIEICMTIRLIFKHISCFYVYCVITNLCIIFYLVKFSSFHDKICKDEICFMTLTFTIWIVFYCWWSKWQQNKFYFIEKKLELGSGNWWTLSWMLRKLYLMGSNRCTFTLNINLGIYYYIIFFSTQIPTLCICTDAPLRSMIYMFLLLWML